MQAPTKQDERQLAKVHPDLVKVVRAVFATSQMPFRVLEGARTKEQQRKNIEAGVSWTMNSRHIPGRNGYAHAVDLVPLVNGQPSWSWPVYRRFAPVVKAAAASVGVTVEWGGDWRNTKDAPHWQLPRMAKYAAMGGGPADDDEGCCGGNHPMTDSEGGRKHLLKRRSFWRDATGWGGGVGLTGLSYFDPQFLVYLLAFVSVWAVIFLILFWTEISTKVRKTLS